MIEPLQLTYYPHLAEPPDSPPEEEAFTCPRCEGEVEVYLDETAHCLGDPEVLNEDGERVGCGWKAYLGDPRD